MRSTIGKALTIALATAAAASAVADEHAKNKDVDKTRMVAAEMRLMDSNGDGKISAAEHAAGAEQMFQGMDGNQDNRVTSAEMDAGQEPLKTQDPSHAGHGSHAGHAPMSRELSSAEKIKKIDTDGDGVLTAQEHAAGSKKMFSTMDADKDGFLTTAEIKTGHEKMLTASDD